MYTKQYLKQLKKQIKKKYTRQIYKISKKEILYICSNTNQSENILFEFLDILSNFQNNKYTLKEILELYKKNPKLTISLVEHKFSFESNNLNKYLNIFGEKLLDSHLEDILSLNIDHPNFNVFLPYLKDNEILLTKLIIYKYNIILKGKESINGYLVINNFEKYINAINDELLTNFNNSEIEKYLSLEPENNIKFQNCLNFIRENKIYISRQDIFSGSFAKISLLKYLITNQQYLDVFINKMPNEIKNNNDVLYLSNFFINIKNNTIVEKYIHTLMYNELDFNQSALFLKALFFHNVIFRQKLNKMLENRNFNHHEYTKDINNYLDCYEKLQNIENNEDLIEFYKLFKNCISYKKMKEYIIIEYNKHLNESLTSLDDLRKSDKITISTEKFVSNQYSNSGEIQIYTLHNAPLNFLGHSIIKAKDDKYSHSSDIRKQKEEFTKKLCASPHLWTSTPEHGTNYISMSLDNISKVKPFGLPTIYLGFNQVTDKQIKASRNGDAATPMVPGTIIENTLNLDNIEEIIFGKTIGYSEFISHRRGVLPNFLITATKPTNTNIPLLTDEAREWALYYNIPIFNIDVDSYFKAKYTTFKEYFQELKNRENFPSNEEIKTLLFFQQATNLFLNQSETKYPELSTQNQYFLLLELASFDNRKITPENLTNFDNLINTISCLSNADLQQIQELKKLRLLIEQKEQESLSEYNNATNKL